MKVIWGKYMIWYDMYICMYIFGCVCVYAKKVVHDDKYMSPYILDYKVLVLRKICSLWRRDGK